MRGDDGLAWHVAEHLESRLNNASTQLLCRVQLTPELADAMSRADRVLFVDATAEGQPGEIRWSSIRADENDIWQSFPNFTHQSSPQSLLSLCHTLYGVAPKTTVVTAAVASCELGEPLSEKVEAAVLEIAASIEAWLKKTIEMR
jgi:hydrogenase maturation protease